MNNNRSEEFINGLRGDIVVRNVGPGGALPLTSALAIRSWFDARRASITSSGGRPSDPSWTIKRQIPFDDATWDRLKALAADISKEGRKISPAQIAAILLQDATSPQRPSNAKKLLGRSSDAADASVDLPEPYRVWRQRGVFAA